jgi:hypothetical protein
MIFNIEPEAVTKRHVSRLHHRGSVKSTQEVMPPLCSSLPEGERAVEELFVAGACVGAQALGCVGRDLTGAYGTAEGGRSCRWR